LPTKHREQARLFLQKAAEDEALLDEVQDRPGVADAIYGFHCQQAAEKLLKALLSHGAVRFPRTHDLAELISLLEAAGHKLPAALSRVDEFTPSPSSSATATYSLLPRLIGSQAEI
jgi:HEPN domain-containing protein